MESITGEKESFYNKETIMIKINIEKIWCNFLILKSYRHLKFNVLFSAYFIVVREWNDDAQKSVDRIHYQKLHFRSWPKYIVAKMSLLFF